MPENKDALPSFTLTWRNGSYYVSKPNIDTCEVVRQSDALAIIEQLQAENAELAAFVVAVGGFWGHSKSVLTGENSLASAIRVDGDEFDRLQAENARLKRDAERYRYIRVDESRYHLAYVRAWDGDDPVFLDKIDAAIDAAMQAQKEQG